MNTEKEKTSNCKNSILDPKYNDVRCPIEYTLDLFNRKTSMRIVCVLSQNDRMRYCEISSNMVNVSDSVLTSSLKDLMDKGLVQRCLNEDLHPKFVYFLTKKGTAFCPVLQSICGWVRRYYRDDDAESRLCLKCEFEDL